MGREATCECTWPNGQATVHVLLETNELILRGALKRRIPFAAISQIEAVGEELRITTATGPLTLHLGEKQAASWAAKLQAPPKTLREKLGLATGAKALILGPIEDAALIEALAQSQAETPHTATLTIAIVTTEPALAAARQSHAQLPPTAPIWIVHAKGKSPGLGEAAVRAHMRAAGFMDTKITAVSATLTATRFSRPNNPTPPS